MAAFETLADLGLPYELAEIIVDLAQTNLFYVAMFEAHPVTTMVIDGNDYMFHRDSLIDDIEMDGLYNCYRAQINVTYRDRWFWYGEMQVGTVALNDFLLERLLDLIDFRTDRIVLAYDGAWFNYD